MQEGGATSSTDVAVTDCTEVDKTSKESVSVEQGQLLRADEPDQCVLKVKNKATEREILEFTHLLLGSRYTACVYVEAAGDLHRRRQGPDLENASVDRTDVAAMTRPNEVTEYRVRVGCDRLDEWRLGVCSIECQNEPGESTLQNTVDQTRQVKTISRNTPRYSHDSLGECESSIKGGETDTCADFSTRREQTTNATATVVQHTMHSQS